MEYVIRKKYHGDILFYIEKIENNISYLRGVYVRILATALLDDLIYVSAKEKTFYENKCRANRHLWDLTNKTSKHITGKILHIDSDFEYLKKCNEIYEKLGLYAICVYLDEDESERYALDLVDEYDIDIVVLTGHDSYNQSNPLSLNSYRNSKAFYKAVRRLREKYLKDELFIYAGACQSNFEALIASGANAASSPKRINIDALDPLVCAVIVATTPFNSLIPYDKVWEYSVSKGEGIGGIDSYGKMRILR
ncbi:MAG: sporulation peptidase YabG [Acholeplasmatales bacterium]|nr:sporulation peptidase YabG [Acholeplasmatales bacterium]